MNTHGTRAALISGDENLRGIVHDCLYDGDFPVSLALEIGVSAPSLEPADLERVRAEDPQIVILDLSSDPDRALRAAASISTGNPRAALVGIGPDLEASRILEAMRAGLVEYLPRPLQGPVLRDALNRVLRRHGWGEAMGGSRDGKLLSFFSAKGGAGATSVMTNVGIELHRITGGKTLLVDLDLELGEIASLLGIQPRFHFVDLVRNFHRMDEDLLASYIESHESGVQVLSAPFEPEIGEHVSGEEITRILDFLRSHFDYVLVDASKSLAPPALAALQAADPIVLVTNMDVPTLRNLKRCLPILDRVTDGNADRLRLVVNRHNPRSLVTVKDLEETLGLEVFATLSNDYQTVIEAISTGRPLVENSDSKYAGELRSLARSIVAGPEAAAAAKKGLVSRILSPFRSGGTPSPATPRQVEASAHG